MGARKVCLSDSGEINNHRRRRRSRTRYRIRERLADAIQFTRG